jgi:hypothetical protein
MATWKISNQHKKNCEEREMWSKDGVTIVRISAFRWGIFNVETNDDNPPEGIDPENPDGIDMYSYSGENAEDGAELEMMDDGWYGDWEFPDDLSEEERQHIIEGWDEDSYDFLEGEGWYNDETEAWLFGPLEIERVDK